MVLASTVAMVDLTIQEFSLPAVELDMARVWLQYYDLSHPPQLWGRKGKKKTSRSAAYLLVGPFHGER